jgi:Uma2 family endonuclease
VRLVTRSQITPEEYLALDRASPAKNEYYEGEMFAMGGASERHNVIVANLVAELRQHLKKKPCKVYASDMRVRVADSGLYTYPDVVVVCGNPEIEGEDGDVLLNPKLIVEVLSPSTEAYDRGEKFRLYRTLPSLSAYLLVSQSRSMVERFDLGADGHWVLSEARGLATSIELPAIACQLELAEIYDKTDLT